MSYRDEMIQVAAVALASIQCDDRGNTNLNSDDAKFYYRGLLEEVTLERVNQEAKWGAQSHSPERWLTILHEETGEVARAILERDFN